MKYVAELRASHLAVPAWNQMWKVVNSPLWENSWLALGGDDLTADLWWEVRVQVVENLK